MEEQKSMKGSRTLLMSGMLLLAMVMLLACQAGAEKPGDDAAQQAEKKENLTMAKWETQIELANTYKEAGKADEALAEFRKALAFEIPPTLSEERRNEVNSMLIHVYGDMADLLVDKKKDFDGAIETLKAALVLAEKLPAADDENKEKRIHLNKRIASILREQGKPDAAIEYLKKAQEIQ
jgi:tetratricopeptide (TPR) repeat protein